jgi:hypothetical protein
LLNLQTMLAVQGQIFLFPLVLTGLWRYAVCRRPGRCAGMDAHFLVMTVVFLIRARGGFFHSGAALQPLFWAVTPAGFYAFIEWGVRKRGWDVHRAGSIFKIGLVSIALLLTIIVTFNRVLGGNIRQPAWDDLQRRYAWAEHELISRHASKEAVVLVNDAHLLSARVVRRSPSLWRHQCIAAGRTQCVEPVSVVRDRSGPGDLLYRAAWRPSRLTYLGPLKGSVYMKSSHPDWQHARRLELLALVSALSVTGYLLASRLVYRLGFPLDDAWIHQTYARNLALHGEWAFLPGQPSAGSTAPLWSALLAVGHVVHLGPYVWTYLLGWATLLLVAQVVCWLFAIYAAKACADLWVVCSGKVASGVGGCLWHKPLMGLLALIILARLAG